MQVRVRVDVETYLIGRREGSASGACCFGFDATTSTPASPRCCTSSPLQMPAVSQVSQSAVQQKELILNPVTALKLVPFGPTLLLLAGEGPHLHIFDVNAGKRLRTEQPLGSHAIHGVTVQIVSFQACDAASVLKCLVWGGRFARALSIEATESLKHSVQIRCIYLSYEITTPDWIVDSCFSGGSSSRGSNHSGQCNAFLLTSHNTLLSFASSKAIELKAPADEILRPIAAGPRSALYSGHVACLDSDCVLIAAGTVFGEILLWSAQLPKKLSRSNEGSVSRGRLLHTFLGHEGSIFGVRLLDSSLDVDNGGRNHLLASCSDDRTVRLWNISKFVGNSSDPDINVERSIFRSSNSQSPTMECRADIDYSVATARGHVSRIWSLSRVPATLNSIRLFSFGEDATSRLWHYGPRSISDCESKVLPHRSRTLNEIATYTFHSGKNIWSSAIHLENNGKIRVSTGGADGRILLYYAPALDGDFHDDSMAFEWTIAEVLSQCFPFIDSRNSLKFSLQPPGFVPCKAKGIFDGMRGRWSLSREIKSMLPTYPSGHFQGTAILDSRPPTDEAYEAEYLYCEDGCLVTEQGLTIKAHRRYVYRYQEKSDTITIWFVKTDDENSVDYLFHELKPIKMTEEEVAIESHLVRARGHHLCIDDDYDAEHVFNALGQELLNWNVMYQVKGPKKDYSISAAYTRTRERIIQDGSSQGSDALGVLQSTSKDSFKSYAWLGYNTVIATTVQGRVLSGSVVATPRTLPGITNSQQGASHSSTIITWQCDEKLPELSSYCIAVSVDGHEAALLGGVDGSIYLYEHSSRSAQLVIKLQTKITGIFVQKIPRARFTQSIPNIDVIQVIATCIGSSIAYISMLDMTTRLLHTANSSLSPQILINLPSTFVVTSHNFLSVEGLLVLGSRNGALAFFHFPNTPQALQHDSKHFCFRRIHDEETVTTIKSVPNTQSYSQLSNPYILTAGRDGKCAVHSIIKEGEASEVEIRLETVHAFKPSFGPNVEGALFDQISGDLLVWGFHSKDFVVWNDTKQMETMRAECGGSHRNWAYSPSDNGKDGGRFIWTKASTCKVYLQLQSSHQVLQPGGHGREIKAIATYRPRDDKVVGVSNLIATGAEDTSIRIFRHSGPDTEHPNFECLRNITGHTAGIQQLRWSSCGKYLFSAAGNEEFFAWRVQFIPCFGIGVTRNSTCPKVTDSSDLRVMGFEVVAENRHNNVGAEECFVLGMVYSDSTVRVGHFCYSKVELVTKLK